jgi:hypothetical protein
MSIFAVVKSHILDVQPVASRMLRLRAGPWLAVIEFSEECVHHGGKLSLGVSPLLKNDHGGLLTARTVL